MLLLLLLLFPRDVDGPDVASVRLTDCLRTCSPPPLAWRSEAAREALPFPPGPSWLWKALADVVEAALPLSIMCEEVKTV